MAYLFSYERARNFHARIYAQYPLYIDLLQNSPISIRYILSGLVVCIVLYTIASITIVAFSEEVGAVFNTFSFFLLIKFLVLITISLAIRTLRWCYLNRIVNSEFNWRQTAGIYIGGFSIILTPGRVGELWRAWALNFHQKINYRKALPLIFCDRLFDLNALLLFASTGVFVTLTAYRLPAFAAMVLFLMIFLLMLKPNWIRLIIKLLWKICGKRLPRLFASLLAMVRHVKFIVRPVSYFPLLILSLSAWSFEGWALFYIATELNGILNFHAALITIALGNIAGVLSLLPGGIGGYDVAMIYLLQEYGNTLSLALTISIIRIANVFYAALLGLPFFVYFSCHPSIVQKNK